jgi:hypothetical protein
MNTPVIIESVGFSASEAIAEYLSLSRNTVVVHGSRNFNEPTAFGDAADLPAGDFLAQMLQTARTGRLPIAVHCYYPPNELARIAQSQTVVLLGLMRKDFKRQILSNYAWRLNGLLAGRTLIMNQLNLNYEERRDGLRNAGVEPNVYTHLLLQSVESITNYNAALKEAMDVIVFMEDILDDPARLVALCGLENTSGLPNDLPRRNSHNDLIRDMDIFPDMDFLFADLVGRLRFNAAGKRVSFIEFQNSITEAN